MRLRELAKAAGVPKDTIHFYVREGLLPKPRKRSRNVAEYDEAFVERIKYIKELQDNHFLPLSVIKRILKHQDRNESRQWSLAQVQGEYFRAIDRLLPKEVEGEEAFCQATGLGPKWLAKMEEWGVITPDEAGGRKVYSQDDVAIGKVVVDMDRAGMGPKDGFDPEALRHYRERFAKIVELSTDYLLNAAKLGWTDDEMDAAIEKSREIMGVFFYHLNRKLSKLEYNRRTQLISNQDTEPG